LPTLPLSNINTYRSEEAFVHSSNSNRSHTIFKKQSKLLPLNSHPRIDMQLHMQFWNNINSTINAACDNQT
jgi:hypothetical protein